MRQHLDSERRYLNLLGSNQELLIASYRKQNPRSKGSLVSNRKDPKKKEVRKESEMEASKKQKTVEAPKEEKEKSSLTIESAWESVATETRLHVLEVFGTKQTGISIAIQKLLYFFYGVFRPIRDDSDSVMLLISVLSCKKSSRITCDQLSKGWSLVMRDHPSIPFDKSSQITKLIVKLLPDTTETVLILP